MTQEEKQLLLIDLCGRLPYGIKIRIEYPFLEEKDWQHEDLYGLDLRREVIADTSIRIEEFKPYLRPMSSMNVEEGERLEQIAIETHGDFMFEAEEDGGAIYHMDKWKTLSPAMFDYLNSIHIDYRGLIKMGLALEAPEGMYN